MISQLPASHPIMHRAGTAFLRAAGRSSKQETVQCMEVGAQSCLGSSGKALRKPDTVGVGLGKDCRQDSLVYLPVSRYQPLARD